MSTHGLPCPKEVKSMSKEHIIWSDTIFKDRKSMERWAADVREMLIEEG